MNPLYSFHIRPIKLAAYFLLFSLDSLAQTQDCDCFTECDNYVRNSGFEASFEQFSSQNIANIPCWENVFGTPHIYDRDNTNCLFSIPAIIPVGGSFPPWIIETWDHDISNNQTLCLTGQESVRSELNFPILNNSTFNIEFHFLRPDSFVNVTLDSLYIGFSNVELTSNIWSNPAMHIFSFELTYEDYADGFNQWGLINDPLLNNSGVAFTHIYIGRDFSLGGLVWVDDIRITDQQSDIDATIALNYEFQNDSIIYICHNSVDSIGLFPSPSLNCPIFWTSNEVPVFAEFEEHCLDTASTFNSLISTDTIVYLLPDTTTTYTVHSFGCATDFTFTIVVLPEEDNEYLLDDTLLFECPYDTVNLMTYFSGDSADFYLDSLSNFLVDDLLQVNGLDTSEHTLFAVFTSESGCPDTLERVFFVPQTIQLDSLLFSEYLCAYQDCVGEAEVFATTTNTPLQYFWNEANIPSDTSYVDTLCHGINALRIVDSLGCILDTTINISFFECTWTVDFTVGDTALSCYGDVTSIGISINGGTGPVTIICDSDTICELTLLPALYVLTNVHGGAHHIIVQDALCCQEDTIIYIAEAPDQISMNITTQNNTCYDQCNGSFDVEVTGGIEPYQFFWTLNGLLQSNTEDIDSLCSGQYAFGILDENSCFTVYDSLVIEEICCAEIVINLDSTYFSCPGVAEAGAYISVAGGAEPYSFIWNGPTASGLEDPINMIPGDYTLVVVDANGCSDSLEVVIPSTPMAEDPNNAGFVIPVGTSDWDITTWGTTDVYFDEDITVPDSAILNITGLNLFFTPGHGINVLPNGLLNAENCKFDVACGLYWDGFRVEGFTQPDSIVQRGVLELEACSLTHALVAAASHRITLPAGTNPEINVVPASTDVTTQGGYIKANGCTFIDNKRDIDIRKTANQKSHIQEGLFGECMFRISSLPVIPSLTEPNVRIFLAGVTNVFFESCNLDNNNPVYLGINTVIENNLFIGLQANNATFFWEGENARVLHFRTGIRISGRYMGIAGDDIERTTQIRGTIFNNLISVMATNELDVFIAQNSFTNLDGVVWTYPGYSINSNARSYGIFLNGLSSTGSQFDIIENQFAFNSIPNIDYNQATGILVKDSRGIRSNLIYGNTLWGCQRYAMNFIGKNRSGNSTSLGLHYECNTFGNVNNSALWNRYDVYVEFSNLGGYGVAPIQRNTYGLQLNGSAGNNFQSSILPSSFSCDDVEYTTTPNSMYTQFYRLFPSSEVSGGGELCDVVIFDPASTAPNSCIAYVYDDFEPVSFGSLTQNLSEYLNLKAEYNQLIDEGNTESLKAQVQMTTTNTSFSLYLELMSISPDLSQEVLLEAIAKENEIPTELLVEVLSNNPLSSKKEVVLEALFNRDNPLSEGEFNQIINAVVYESTRKQMEIDLSNLEAEYHIAQNRQLQNLEIESPSSSHELVDLFEEDLFKEDLLMKSVFIRGLGDWSGSIALLQTLPDKHILSEQDKVVIMNEVELLSLESEIVNQQLGHISDDQISLLMNWHMDHQDITCARASELLFIYAGINNVPYCVEDDYELKKFNHSRPNKFTSSFRISPNIVRDYCTIHLEELSGYVCSIKVTDMTGKELKSLVTKPDQNQIILSLSDLSSGMYHITLVCESKNFTDVQKIIKE